VAAVDNLKQPLLSCWLVDCLTWHRCLAMERRPMLFTKMEFTFLSTWMDTQRELGTRYLLCVLRRYRCVLILSGTITGVSPFHSTFANTGVQTYLCDSTFTSTSVVRENPGIFMTQPPLEWYRGHYVFRLCESRNSVIMICHKVLREIWWNSQCRCKLGTKTNQLHFEVGC